MICPTCHTANADNAERCHHCGSAVSSLFDSETIMGSAVGAREGHGLGISPAKEKDKAAVGVADSSSFSGSGFSSHNPVPAEAIDFGPRYRVECLLGEGGMGTVYKAYDTELDRTVALKLVRRELVSNPASLQRLKQELLLASKISHKNILRIHDLGDAPGGAKFISMAYIEGEDLHALLKREGKLPVDRAARIARQLFSALDAAHAEGVVHRDLKPQNILVDRNENIYVSDFGLARLLGSDSGMTRTGEFLGTPRYMSPEQAEAKQVDHRTDLYACGLILCEMLTGEIPFSKVDSALQMMFQRVQESPHDPKQLNPELPDYLCRIIQKCLQKDLQQRYQTAPEVLADLDAGRAPSLVPSGSRTLQITIPAGGKGRSLLVAAAIVIVALASLTIPSIRHRLFRESSTSVATTTIPPLSQGRFVAVLPFRVLGDNKSLTYAADGIVEALSAKIFQLDGVHISSVTDIQKVKNLDNPQKAARELGVNLIVQGTLQGTGDQMRVVVSLLNVADDKRIWTQEFSGVTQDLLTLEDQIYTKLLPAMQVTPSSAEIARTSSRPTENVEAYDIYLRGRNALRGVQDIKNVEAAIKYFDDAIKKDPSFALAYAGLSDASLEMYTKKKDSFWSDKALAAAQQAARLNDKLPEVHVTLGRVFNTTGKTSESIQELNKALQLAPNSDEVYRRLGAAYMANDNKDDAIRAYQKAIALNPYYWQNHNDLGAAYFRLGENAKALEEFRRVTELEPDNAFGFANLGNAYYREGKWDECIASFQKAIALQPTAASYSNLGVVYFFLKRYDDAVKMFAKAAEMSPNDETLMGNLADAYRWSGNREQANASYDKAISLAYKALQVNPRSSATMANLALYYAKKGDAAQALSFIRRGRSINRGDVELIYDEALVNALGSHYSDAVVALTEALQKGYPAREMWNDPELSTLQKRPEFAQIAQKYASSK